MARRWGPGLPPVPGRPQEQCSDRSRCRSQNSPPSRGSGRESSGQHAFWQEYQVVPVVRRLQGALNPRNSWETMQPCIHSNLACGPASLLLVCCCWRADVVTGKPPRTSIVPGRELPFQHKRSPHQASSPSKVPRTARTDRQMPDQTHPSPVFGRPGPGGRGSPSADRSTLLRSSQRAPRDALWCWP